MDVSGNVPKRRPIRWGAVLVSLPLSAVAGYVALGRWRRALLLVAAEIVYFIVATVMAGLGKPWPLAAVLVLAILHALAALVDMALLSRRPLHQPDFLWALAAGLGAVFFTVLLGWAFLRYGAESFHSTTGTMLPTLEVGDRILVSRFTRKVGRGDILVFQLPTDPSVLYAQRVIAVGGDVISSEEGDVLVNGQAPRSERAGVEQRVDPLRGVHTVERWRETVDGKSYVIYRRAGPIAPLARERIPEGHFYLLGDNRESSNDSRTWGTLAPQNVRGRAMFIWWSDAGQGPRWDRISQPVK